MNKALPIFIGLIFVGFGLLFYYRNNTLIKNCTTEIMATVVNMREESETDNDGRTSYIYYPIIEYNVENEIIKTSMSSGSNSPAYSVGDRITILYNPNNPKEFIVKGDKSSELFVYIFLGIGAFITVAGIINALKKD